MTIWRKIFALTGAALSASPAAGQTLGAAPAPAGIVVQQKAAANFTQIGGTVTFNVTLTVNPLLTNGASVYWSASASVYDASSSGSHGISGGATVNNGTVTISGSLPYVWLVSSSTDTMNVGISVSGSVNTSVSYSFSTGFSSSLTLPANGATTPLTFTGTL